MWTSHEGGQAGVDPGFGQNNKNATSHTIYLFLTTHVIKSPSLMSLGIPPQVIQSKGNTFS